MKKRILFFVAVAAIIVAVAAGLWTLARPQAAAPQQTNRKEVKANQPKKGRHGAKANKKRPWAGANQSKKRAAIAAANAGSLNDDDEEYKDPMEVMFGHLEPADKAIAIKVQEAMDKDDRTAAFTAALKAMTSQSADLRKHAIDALSWSGGPQALPHLTKMLTDPATEVAESALNAVQNVLMNVEDASTRFKAAAMYMDDYKDNADARVVFAGIMASSSGDLLETAESRKEVIDMVLKFIYSGGECGEEAKALYHNITGADWANQGEAYKWVQDPETFSGTWNQQGET